MTLTLTDAELREVTGYKRPADQLRELHRQGYWRARRSPTTGRIILERGHYDAVLAGQGAAANDAPRRPRPKVVPVA